MSFGMSPLRLSVIVPALNEARVISQCLASLARQNISRDSYEVIVADNGSTDRTLDIAREFQQSLNLTVVQRKNVHISALRNYGADVAEGEFLAFLDADCIAPEDWLSQAIVQLAGERRGVVGAHYTIPADSSWVARAWYQDMRTSRQGPVAYVPAGCLLVAREVFLAVGGFDETIETSEDCEFCQRVSAAGRPVVAVPGLSVVHLGTPQTVSAFFRKQRWHGRSVHTVFLRNKLHSAGAMSTLFAFYAFGCLAASAAGLAVAVFSGNWAAFLLPALPLPLGSFLLAARATLRRKRWGWLAPLTLLYLVYGVARGLCLAGMGSPRRTQPAPAGGPDGSFSPARGSE